MKTVKVSDPPRDLTDTRLLDSAQRQLDALRAAINARLAELESALDDPAASGSLTRLILDLSRLATSEAQAAAARACLEVKQDGDATLLEADARSSAAIAAERKTSSGLRRSLEASQQRTQLAETERHEVLQASHEQQLLLESERATRADIERAIVRLERQVKDASAELKDERESVRRAAAEATDARELVASTEKELRRAQQRLASEQDSAKVLAADAAVAGERATAFEQQFLTAKQQLEGTQRELAAERAAASTLADAHARAQARVAELEPALAQATRSSQQAQRQAEDTARGLAEAVQGRERNAQSLAAAVRERDEGARVLAEGAAELEAERALGADLRNAQAASQAAHQAMARELASGRQLLAELQRADQELRQVNLALQADLLAERSASAAMRGAASGSSEERAALVHELERVAAAKATLEASLTEERKRAGSRLTAGDAWQAALAQSQASAQAARADLAMLQQRLAEVEARRASAEDAATEHEMRAGLVERERDALSLALDTERMVSTGLRAAADDGARQAIPAKRKPGGLRKQPAEVSRQTASVPPPAAAPDDEGETELTFAEDSSDRPEDEANAVADVVWESVRRTPRYSFTSRVDLKVNGKPGVLADLSVGGCRISTSAPIEVGERVRVELPGDPTPLVCSGTVAWVSKEPAEGKTPARRRAGIEFVQASAPAIEAFIIIRADV